MVMGSGSAIDFDSIISSINIFKNRLGQCVVKTEFRNTRSGAYEKRPITPREARLTVAPGIQQIGGFFDIQWWSNGDYKYHYQEENLQFRFDREEDNKDTDKPIVHFHPPADVNRHDPSCISSGHPPERVTLAVIANWFPAAEKNDPSILNSVSNPP